MNGGIKVSRLTASGRGAVAVLQVVVDDAANADIIDRCFVAKNGMLTADADQNRILYGDWGPEDVVVVRTGPRQWEINCHGGEIAARRIQQDLIGGTTSGDSANQNAPNDHSDFITQLQHDLLQRLLHCRTQQTARHLLAQQQGVLVDFLQQLTTAASWNDVSNEVQQCLNWRHFSDHLTAPWQIAIFGQPNAGKSSLLNAIVGYDRSIVFEQPGTTRDRVETDIVLDGWPFRLIDTAGIRDQTNSEIETEGVASARQSLHDADACVLVVDSVAGWTDVDSELLNSVPAKCPCVVLMNKCDLTANDHSRPTPIPHDVPVIHTSTVTTNGLTELNQWLPAKLIPEQPPLNQPLPVVPSVADLLLACQQQSSVAALQQALRT